MLWWLLKKIVIYGSIVGIAVLLYTQYGKRTLDDNEDIRYTKMCSVDGNTSICAAGRLTEGLPLGLVARIEPETGDEPAMLSAYKLIKKVEKDEDSNIDLKPLYIDSKRVDLYGYVKKDVKEGDELKITVV